MSDTAQSWQQAVLSANHAAPDTIPIARADLVAIRNALVQSVECGTTCEPCDENMRSALTKLEGYLNAKS